MMLRKDQNAYRLREKEKDAGFNSCLRERVVIQWLLERERVGVRDRERMRYSDFEGKF